MLLAVLPGPTFAKPWKGIFPLKTTRAEVVKRFGPPTGIDKQQRAIFADSDGTVKISWKRPACIAKDFLWSEKDADDNAVVYQITLEPNIRFRSVEDYEKSEPTAKPEPTLNGKEDIKAAYKRWLEQDISCLVGEGSSSCSVTNDRTGFGYSDSSEAGVTSIYYFATMEETEAFLSSLKPCAIKAEANESNW